MSPLTENAIDSECADAAERRSALRSYLSALSRGERDALGPLYASHGALVFRTARRLTGNRADAEDVTQDVFVRLGSTIGGFVGTTEQFAGWLRRVAVRASLMRMRGGRRRREVDVQGVAALVTRSDDALARISLESALERLSPEHRTVFLLKEVEGYDHAEIAELVGITVANSEVRLHRARRQLRDLLRGSR
ncbi:MAG: polymerase sigma factor, sigma-70 family [Gemmatimonadetes bacterium]|nr:polymerase sigma factor, sigma-70 family [Gemmatimonadota bacterium]